jgi:aldehyde:ferredoxin oxidoreductase
MSSPGNASKLPEHGVPRVWNVRLGSGDVPESSVEALGVSGAGRARLASAGGAALAAVLCERSDPDAVPLVLAVGDAVKRGLPTAARLTVASRSPASGLYVDGQLGGSLARRLVRCADALTLHGRTDIAGAVLILDARGGAVVESWPELIGASPFVAARVLRSQRPEAAVLTCGPAGEAGFEHASLFSGEDPPSSVGRGGLGAVLGRTGLKAIVFEIAPLEPSADKTGLRERLTASPRLLARAEGGSFELIEAFAARGDLSGPEGDAVDSTQVDHLRATADSSQRGQHGCAGCPTPCGWVFERPGGGRRGGRFSAVAALGPRLGLDDFDAVMNLLEACDRVGVDAKETGEALALLARARAEGRLEGPALNGDARALQAEIDALATNAGALAGGAVGVAQRAGLQDALRRVRGQSVRERKSLAALLGQCVSARGADPMRAFPFLAEDGAGELDAERLALPFALPPSAADPSSEAATGRLVWWHENLSAALDATGFCAFSAGALLADGGATAGELADWILPAGWRGAGAPADALQSLGASAVLLQRDLNRRWGEADGADLPDWARERLDRPCGYGEYRALRGLDDRGRVIPEAASRLGSHELAGWGARRLPADEHQPAAVRATPRATTQQSGQLELRASGALGRLLAELDSAWPLPASIAELRAEIARRDPRAERWLGTPETPIASVWRAGRRLGEDELVNDGDALDLVVAISGG